MLNRGVGVAEEDLRGVATTRRHGREAVPREVEPDDRSRPVGQWRAEDWFGRLAEAVQEQQRSTISLPKVVEGEADLVV